MALTLTKQAETNSTITLGWTPPAGVEWYIFFANDVRVSNAPPVDKNGIVKNSIRFSKPGEPYQVVAIIKSGGNFSVEVGTYTTAPPPPPPPSGDKLRDKPPGYPDYPGYLRVKNDGRSGYTWADNQDVLFDLGDFSYPEGIALTGGRNVVVIGGRLTATGSGRAQGVSLAVWPRTTQSHYYVEGVRIRPAKDAQGKYRRTMNDGIAIRGGPGKVTFQNCLIGPVAIKEGFTSSQAHADVFQVQEAVGVHIRAHRFTGYTEYTGVMESEYIVPSQDWSHVNMVATGYTGNTLTGHLGSPHRGHTVFGMYGAGVTANMPNLTFDEFYWARDPLQSWQGGYSPPELVTQKGAKYGKPKNAQNQDYDYVTEDALALPYVSPGYA